MTKWFDLGMSHPLALGMAHPLADRLETLSTPKANKAWARGATATLVLGIATVSAPLTIADNHPEKSLKDTVVTSNSNKSVIKIHKTDEDGNEIKKHYEIKLDGDDFEAYEFDEDGNKRKVDPSEIEGFNLEDAKKSKSWAFSVGDDNQLKFESGKNIDVGSNGIVQMLGLPGKGEFMRLYKVEGMEELSSLRALKQLSESESIGETERLKILKALKKIEGLEGLEDLKTELPDVMVWDEGMSEPPKPPFPPGYKKEGGQVSGTMNFVFSDDKELNGKTPMRFKMKEGYVVIDEETHMADAKLAAAKSMLESVESMLTDVEGMEETTRELEKTRKELNKARKALEAAEARMKKEAAE